MKEVQITAYEAWDGEVFKTPSACINHENKSLHKRLVGWTEADAINALNRDDAEKADILEKAGLAVRKARREAGEFKRPPRAKDSKAAPLLEQPSFGEAAQ